MLMLTCLPRTGAGCGVAHATDAEARQCTRLEDRGSRRMGKPAALMPGRRADEARVEQPTPGTFRWRASAPFGLHPEAWNRGEL